MYIKFMDSHKEKFPVFTHISSPLQQEPVDHRCVYIVCVDSHLCTNDT